METAVFFSTSQWISDLGSFDDGGGHRSQNTLLGQSEYGRIWLLKWEREVVEDENDAQM